MEQYFCGECGAQLPDGALFCPECGSRTALMPDVPNLYAQSFAKKPLSVGRIIAFAAAAVVLAGIIGVIALMRPMTYAQIEEKFISDIFGLYFDYKYKNIAFDFSFSPGETLSGVLPSGKVSYSGEMVRIDGKTGVEVKVSEGEADGLLINLLMAEGVFNLGIPGVTDYYYAYGKGDAPLYYMDTARIDLKKLQKSFKNLIRAYDKITAPALKRENATLREKSASVQCDRYTVEFTGDMAAELILALASEAENNENLTDFFSGYLKQAGTSAKKVIRDLKRSAESLSDDVGGDLLFSMQVWVKDGKIIGRAVDNIYESPDVRFEYKYVKQDANVYIGGELSMGAQDALTVEGYLKNGSDGSISVFYNSYGYKSEYTVVCKNVKITGTRFSGEFSVENDHRGAGSVSVDIEKRVSAGISLPEFDEKYAIDPNVDYREQLSDEEISRLADILSAAMEKYEENSTVYALLENLYYNVLWNYGGLRRL